MILYDGSGQPFETESGAISIKAPNTGYDTSPTSFFGAAEKTVTGDGTSAVLELSAVGFPNTYIGTYNAYCGVWAECDADCKIRLYNAGTYSSNPPAQRSETLALIDVQANTKTYIYGVLPKTMSTAAAGRTYLLRAEFESADDANGKTLKANKGVCFDAGAVFGSNVPDANTIAILLSKYTDNYITDESELWSANIVGAAAEKTHLRSDAPLNDPYARLNDDKQFEAGGAINSNWIGWNYIQNSYGNNSGLCPIPNQFHGKINTDAQVSVVPLYGHWGRLAVTTGAGDWGGHVFHGWNDAQTYRLTMMASGGMTSPDADFKPREDEFCIHVFSPTNAYSNPIGLTESESENRVTRVNDDVFSGGAYYGRLRIGADRTDEGFLFRAKSLTCYGDVDINGKKFSLGASANVPASANASGTPGQVAYDSNYVYICVAANTWKRAALETW